MKYCKNCKKIIEDSEETYRDMCLKCYQEYLYEKIEHLGEGPIVFEPYPKENNFKNFIKKIFLKKKK